MTQFACGARILRVIHGQVEHPSGAAPPETPHARATHSLLISTRLSDVLIRSRIGDYLWLSARYVTFEQLLRPYSGAHDGQFL
jgi:hypothetical protein